MGWGGQRGGLGRLLTCRQSQANLVERTLAPDEQLVGKTIGSISWPIDSENDRVIGEFGGESEVMLLRPGSNQS